jgi:Calcineurin-like phosphoesterase
MAILTHRLLANIARLVAPLRRGGGAGAPGGGAQSLPRPDVQVVIVGDVHGRLDLLDALLAKIEIAAPSAMLVLVGDYVDRGPDSRAVLARLLGLAPGAVCLRGNHEAMLLEFLDAPIERGGRWLRNGGVQTLASFGIDLDDNASADAVMSARTALGQAMADGTEAWLRQLPLTWQSGNLLVTHAGPDPASPVDGQNERDFLWGHGRFLRDPRKDGLWVAHGHWARSRPEIKAGRIAVDTGAWTSGRLTAALVDPDGTVRFIATR